LKPFKIKSIYKEGLLFLFVDEDLRPDKRHTADMGTSKNRMTIAFKRCPNEQVVAENKW
jgi:hypothetical protein